MVISEDSQISHLIFTLFFETPKFLRFEVETVKIWSGEWSQPTYYIRGMKGDVISI